MTNHVSRTKWLRLLLLALAVLVMALLVIGNARKEGAAADGLARPA